MGNMELSEEHKKELDDLISIGVKDNLLADVLFEKFMKINSKYNYKEDKPNILDKKIIRYDPLTFEPIYEY